MLFLPFTNYFALAFIGLQIVSVKFKLFYNDDMHYRLREFANPSRSPLYPTVHINIDTLYQYLTRFSK